MLILPYSTELRLSERPWVVYSVMLLCLVIFYFQQGNRSEVYEVINTYCDSIYEPEKDHAEYDYMRRNKESCAYYLVMMNEVADLDYWLEYNKKRFGKVHTVEELEKFAVHEIAHYKNLVKMGVPESLDAKLMYYPGSFNPITMLTSALSHADWSHIIFNLIFFFAFAPALELLSRSKLKFIALLVSVEIIGGVLYSISSILSDSNIPTLGLSGSVMAMIGFSAFMMPWARIRTFFWFLHFAKSYAVPAWILASWYIGWDIYELFSRTENGGVNFLSHVSGGLSGYLLGYLFFKKEKYAAKYELDVEIDYMRNKRESFSNVATLYKGDRVYVDSKQREHAAKKVYGKFSEDLYRHIKIGKTSEAMLLLLEKYDLYQDSPELYIELFNDIGEWKKKRVYLCTGRLIIDLLVEKKKYAQIPQILNLCLEVDNNFALADSLDLVFVVNYLVSVHEYELAYQLVHSAGDKYGEYVNRCDCILLEAKIFWEHLDREADALALLNDELDKSSELDSVKLNELITMIQTTGINR